MAEQIVDLGNVTGPRGPQGLQGKTPYEVAVDMGYTGTEAAYNAILANIGNVHLGLLKILGEEDNE